MMHPFPVIDPEATGANIKRLRLERKLSVVDMQIFFNFDTPRVIYKWQKGQCLPSVDNLYALSVLLEVDMAQILVCKPLSITMKEPQDKTCGSFRASTKSMLCHRKPAKAVFRWIASISCKMAVSAR